MNNPTSSPLLYSVHQQCKNNADTAIIRLLLIQDPQKRSVLIKDRNGSTPLHLACNHEDAKRATIQILLDVEETMSPRPQSALDILKRNPLSLAIKSKAPSDVLALLLSPEYFDITGCGDRDINELARRIKKDVELQKTLNGVLAQRLPFAIFYLNGVVNVVVFVLFLFGCETYLSGDILRNEAFDFWYLFCVILLIVREGLQFKSEKIHYFKDLQSAFEWTSIGLLITSWCIFTGLHSGANRDTILAFATSILIINLVYFLRNTSLPFSLFAGGLLVILRTLIPFFLVSCMLLFMFSHSLRLTLHNVKSEDIVQDSLREMCAPNEIRNMTNVDEQMACFYGVLNAFFGGSTGVETRDLLDIVFGAIVLLVVREYLSFFSCKHIDSIVNLIICIRSC